MLPACACSTGGVPAGTYFTLSVPDRGVCSLSSAASVGRGDTAVAVAVGGCRGGGGGGLCRGAHQLVYSLMFTCSCAAAIRADWRTDLGVSRMALVSA